MHHKDILVKLVFFIVVWTLNSCSSNDTAYGGKYKEYTKDSNYNYIEYELIAGESYYYLENMELNRTYLLWLIHNDSLVLPPLSDIPLNLSLTKTTYLINSTFNLNLTKESKMINDSEGNVYLRIH